jgi:hypothetical protein
MVPAAGGKPAETPAQREKGCFGMDTSQRGDNMDWFVSAPPWHPTLQSPPGSGPAPRADNPPGAIRMPFDGTARRPVNIPANVSAPVSMALVGAVIAGANALGQNLHRAKQGEMDMSQALARSLMHGTAASLAATTAAVLTANLTDSDVLHLTALAATTAGLSYLISAGVQRAVQNKGGEGSSGQSESSSSAKRIPPARAHLNSKKHLTSSPDRNK